MVQTVWLRTQNCSNILSLPVWWGLVALWLRLDDIVTDRVVQSFNGFASELCLTKLIYFTSSLLLHFAVSRSCQGFWSRLHARVLPVQKVHHWSVIPCSDFPWICYIPTVTAAKCHTVLAFIFVHRVTTKHSPIILSDTRMDEGLSNFFTVDSLMIQDQATTCQ